MAEPATPKPAAPKKAATTKQGNSNSRVMLTFKDKHKSLYKQLTEQAEAEDRDLGSFIVRQLAAQNPTSEV